MNDHRVLIDESERGLIENGLDQTLLVSAGAGTGKTEALVRRIVALIKSGEANTHSIAAITFTKLAAAELRERVRARLVASLIDGELDVQEQNRCDEAIRTFDGMTIKTLHSFSEQLLRERSLDCGVPPSFEIVESIAAEINFDSRWESWLYEIMDSREASDSLFTALVLGLRLETLRDIAYSFHERYDELSERYSTPDLPHPQIDIALLNSESQISNLINLSLIGNDSLKKHAESVLRLIRNIRRIRADRHMTLGALSEFGTIKHTRGRQADWDTDPVTGINACKLLKDILSDLEDIRSTELDSIRSSVLISLLESVRVMALNYARERKAAGQLEFQDLLVLAKDLLSNSEPARSYFSERYSHILIDEFQDTDPVQCEIALLLSSDPLDTRNSNVVPGKLFVVGDPKQSIYKFRGADVSVYEDLKTIINDGHVSLRQNFRSQKRIIDWVNALFGLWMKLDADECDQVEYEDIAPWVPDFEGNGVKFFGESVEGPAQLARQRETQDVVSIIGRIKHEKWRVRSGKGGELRDAQYSDICLLMPTRSVLRGVEEALSKIGIPFRVESQSLVLESQDVSELLACLRAIDSPSDQVSVVAALRSSAFGCSDVDLLRYVDMGGRFDYVESDIADGPVKRAMEIIAEFHGLRVWVSPEQLIESFLRRTRMIESSFLFPGFRERLRRYRLVMDNAASFASVSDSSLRSFLDWIENQIKRGAMTTEAPIPEPDEDSVRIMTVHASKGLEFPIVILAGLGANERTNIGPVLYNKQSSSAEVSFPAQNNGRFKTLGYDLLEVEERHRNHAERTRLMYVACTRAQDHLLLSLHRSESAKGSFAADIVKIMGDESEHWEQIKLDAFQREDAGISDEASPVSNRVDSLETREKWIADRERAIKSSSIVRSVGATALAQIAKEELVEDLPYRTGRAGSNIGRAVHSVLQNVDLKNGINVEEISRVQSLVEGIPDRLEEISRLVRTAIDSPIVVKAVASERYYREVYVGVPQEELILEGFIDLVFESNEGLTIVDYKTDSVDDVDQAMDRYNVQGGAYALALEKATKRPVHQVVFLFLNINKEVAISDLGRAKQDALAKIASFND